MNFAEISNLLSAEIGKDTAEKVISAIRKFAPGETIYIPSRHHPVVGPNDSVKSLMRRGVKRRTAYRLITGR